MVGVGVTREPYPGRLIVDGCLVALGDRMSSLRIRSVLALAGLYSAAALFAAIATSASTTPSSPVAIRHAQSVNRIHKGDLLTHSKDSKDAGSSISVELSARSDVVIRDTTGNILFAVENAARVTTIAKRSGHGAPATKATPSEELDLPAGCEWAFSPYAEPSKGRIIGRCMSGIFSQTEVAS
jgi:hypothetical protein